MRNLLDGSERRLDADTLVLAITNVPDTSLEAELAARGAAAAVAGDNVAARLAVHAIYDGRILGMAL